MLSTIDGRSSIRFRTAVTNLLTSTYASIPNTANTPSTTSSAAELRFMPRSRSHVTGVESTIARNSAMNTQSTACRAATNAHVKAITPRTVAMVLAET